MVGSFVLDALFPPRCPLCERLGPRGICEACHDELEPSDPRILVPLPPMRQRCHLYAYRGRARQAIIKLKFGRDRSLVEQLSRELLEQAEQLQWLSNRLFIPVPIHVRRWAERGFNQSEDLLSTFPRASVSLNALERVRYTDPQVGLSLAEREQNLSKAFQAGPLVRGKSIVLVDDVYTSGATAVEATKALLQAGAMDVSILTVTVAERTNDHVD